MFALSIVGRIRVNAVVLTKRYVDIIISQHICRHTPQYNTGGNCLGPPVGGGWVFCHRVSRIILVCLFRYPAVALFNHRSKSTGGGIKIAAAISTVEAAIFTILK